MKRISQLFFCLFFLVTSISTFAQNKGNLSGNIVDAENKSPLSFSTITIKELNKTAISDSMGKYRFQNITTGAYTIIVSRTGYNNQIKYNIPVSSGNKNEISFELIPNYSNINEVLVKTTRRTARIASLTTALSVQLLTTEEIKTNILGATSILVE